MPFDNSLMLCDGSEDWSYANLVTSVYGTPASVTRNDGGFVVLDIGVAGVMDIAVVLILSESVAVGTGLTVVLEQSAEVAFGDSTYYLQELAKFDILAVTTGVILAAECPATIIKRVSVTKRYLRIKATCDASDDYGVVYCLLSPYPWKVL